MSWEGHQTTTYRGLAPSVWHVTPGGALGASIPVSASGCPTTWDAEEPMVQ